MFENTNLHQLWNHKGDKSILKNNRYIHTKKCMPRLVEDMVMTGGLKDSIIAASSPYQIGGQEGNRSQQHLFVLKSVISSYLSRGKGII